jgi:hypothetical protein
VPQPPAGNRVQITLSNPRMTRDFARVNFSVDYRFDAGGPAIGGHYVWRIKSPQGSYKVDYFAHELANQGTLNAHGIEIHGDNGPFEMFIETRGFGLMAGERLSNSVRVEAAAAGPGLPGAPNIPRPPGMPFPRPPVGPPRR